MVYTKSYLERVYEVPESHLTEAGSREHIDRFPVYDERGKWHLEKKEKPDNRYLEIQSHADECDINVLMARYDAGEVDVLNQVQGFFGDVSEIPENYQNLAGMLNIVMNAEDNFKRLPLDVREKFNHSFTEYLASAGSPDWFTKLGLVDAKPPVDKITDPKSEEEEK